MKYHESVPHVLSWQEEVLVKRNVAAAAAFIAAGFRGRATVQLIEDKVILASNQSP